MATPCITFVLTVTVALLGCARHASGIIAKQFPQHVIVMPEIDPQQVLTCSPDELSNKEFDLIVYGASGSMGQAIVEVLLHGNYEISWALAGRSKEHLTDTLSSHLHHANVTKDMIVTQLTNFSAVQRMAKRAKVIINCASPYENAGTDALIRAAFDGCTHYVDLSRELVWQQAILRAYGKASEARGVAIVQSVGAALADMLAVSAVTDAVNYTKKVPSEVTLVWSKMNSRGSFGYAMSQNVARHNHGDVRQPYILAPDSNVQFSGDIEMDGFAHMGTQYGQLYGWDDRLKMNLQPSYLAPVECAIVRRSMAMKFNNSLVHVKEAMIKKVIDEKNKYQSRLITKDPQGLVRINKPMPDVLPPYWYRAAGSMAGFAIAFQEDEYAPSALVKMEVSGDPAFIAIPKIAVEVAVSLLTGPLIKRGYLTPTAAVPDLESRLESRNQGNFITTTHIKRPEFPMWF